MHFDSLTLHRRTRLPVGPQEEENDGLSLTEINKKSDWCQRDVSVILSSRKATLLR